MIAIGGEGTEKNFWEVIASLYKSSTGLLKKLSNNQKYLFLIIELRKLFEYPRRLLIDV
ncbi:MAG TPA: hypothetical protein IGS40_23165 [Trichormus sp. M33_DOE_039]|nr:hypothetical protein [Trichormus sp. M33_DOE_039]